MPIHFAMTTTPRRAAVALSLAAVSLTAMLGACSSTEKIVYSSDTWHPKTVNLLDSRTGESVVTIDVPVGKQLNMWFQKSAQTAEKEGQDTLHYSIRPLGDNGTTPGTVLSVPPPSARRLDVTLRKAPEHPAK
jgi:hypothetical protein